MSAVEYEVLNFGFLMGLAGIVCAGLIWGAILRQL